jgi:glyoxylase-like metal-dependent hydrolase (beta-lactamase superfamily II)
VRIQRVLAPNPGPFTGPGTNTWVVGDESEVVVIDPGPVESSHADAIHEVVESRVVRAVIVTHTHPDHAPLANPLARTVSSPALGHGPGPDFAPDALLVDGSTVEFAGTSLRVLHTPGHADDHLCFQLDRVLFTGDHIMGGSSVMVDDLSPYMRSLERLRIEDWDRMYPGHGPEIDEPGQVIDWYIAHRLQREREILAAVVDGSHTVEEIVDVVYAEVDVALHPLAARNVKTHLRKLADDGRVVYDGRTTAPA